MKEEDLEIDLEMEEVKFSKKIYDLAKKVLEEMPSPPKTRKDIEEWAEKLANDVKNADD